MPEFDYPTVYPVEPPTLQLMLSGLLTLFFYLAISGKWREVFSLSGQAARRALLTASPADADAVYPICDYEVHFAYTFGNVVRGASGRNFHHRDATSTAAAV